MSAQAQTDNLAWTGYLSRKILKEEEEANHGI